MSTDEALDRIRKEMARSKRRRIGELAVDRGWVSSEIVEAALAEQRKLGLRFGEILVRGGHIMEAQLQELLHEQGSRVLESFERTEEGRRLDQYVLKENIGAGGMSEVWKAWDEELKRWVAVKLLKAGSTQASERFLREARLAGRLHHPNIVPVHGVGDGYIVLQLVEGGPLKAVSFRRAAEIVRDAAKGVQHAHDNDVIHRDLKPANILIDEKGRVLVADFGLARPLSPEAGMTFQGMILGTPGYMSPEQASGDPDRITAASDVFSLGATLYHYVTGNPPYEGGSPGDRYARAVEANPVPPRKRNPRVSRELEAIILKAMEKDPIRRYSSATELSEDLDRFVKGEVVLARPPSTFQAILKHSRRNPIAWILGAAAAVAVIVTLIVLRSGSVERQVRNLVLKAERSYAAGDFDTMRGLVERALELDPIDPDAKFWLARLKLRRYQLLRGVSPVWIVNGLVQHLPLRPETEEETRLRVEIGDALKSVDHPLGRGILLLWNEEYEGALAQLESVPSGAAAYHEARLYSSVVRYLTGDFEGAERILEDPGPDRALFVPALIRTLIARGRELAEMGKPDAARDRFARARGAAVESGDRLREAQTLTAWAEMEDRIGRDPEPRIRDALSILGESADVDSKIARGDALLARAVHLARYGRINADDPIEILDGIREYTGALEREPSLGPVYMKRAVAWIAVSRLRPGLIEEGRDELQKALDDYDRALELLSGHRDARIGRIQVAHDLQRSFVKDWDEFEDSIREELRLLKEVAVAHPDYSPVHRAIGQAWRRIGTHAKERDRETRDYYDFAIDALKRAVDVNPGDLVARITMGKVRIESGDSVYHSLGDPTALYDRAVEDFHGVLSLYPDHPGALLGISMALTGQARYAGSRAADPLPKLAEARKFADRALRANPNEYEAYYWRGLISRDYGEWKARQGKSPYEEFGLAMKDFREAQKIRKGYASAFMSCGDTHVQMALLRVNKQIDPIPQFREAVRDYESAVRSGSDLPWAQEKLGQAWLWIGEAKEGRNESAREEFRTAIACFDEAIRLGSRRPKVFQARAKAQKSLDRYNDP